MSKYCIWCGREIKEDDSVVDQGNSDVGSQPFHENCFDEVRDKSDY